MAQLNHAYEILSDPEKRAAYDRSREAQGGPTATSPSSTSSTQGSSSPRSAPRDSEGYFTLGSTKNEVMAIQGTPRHVVFMDGGKEVWNYNAQDRVEFNTALGRVQAYSNFSGNLRVCLVPGPNVTSYGFFTAGSHKDEVVRLQGTPRSISVDRTLANEKWRYFREGTVEFSCSTGRVTGWEDDGGLKVQSDSTGSSTSYSGRTPPSGGTRASTGSNWRTFNNDRNSIYTVDPIDSDYCLIVRFEDGELELYVAWDTEVSYSETTTVHWQIDEGPSWQQSWDMGSTRKSTFMPSSEVRETIRALMSADEITVRVYPFGGNPITASFRVSGFSEAVGPVLDAWRRAGSPVPHSRLKVCPASFSPSRLWLPSP
jgi:curved DNA-binding protein CbpA